MEALLQEFALGTTLPWQVIAVRLTLSIFLGGIVGFERELLARPAGLRTHMLVCLASATFAIVAVEIVSMPAFSDEQVRADPVRLVEAITAGVAFLAAGFIIFKRGQVRGLTTGAGMWLAAAVGLATGLGLWLIAVLACLLGALVLAALRRLEIQLDLKDAHDDDTRDDEE
ncbi:MgtC/SapB family protein [Chelativorans salis]|uniref:Protein MgtC n=1 Tax=Chelativorans salis TaxID=2978478 RepID=A0ABT2LPE4_9HYPH|nr:MgtC/SapB family protein [Chelativorans sp. EGI FJ00035]MCT7376418.1 MgtC/SapB family protein [Chelativorans sp. EGI FJ00035]